MQGRTFTVSISPARNRTLGSEGNCGFYRLCHGSERGVFMPCSLEYQRLNCQHVGAFVRASSLEEILNTLSASVVAVSTMCPEISLCMSELYAV